MDPNSISSTQATNIFVGRRVLEEDEVVVLAVRLPLHPMTGRLEHPKAKGEAWANLEEIRAKEGSHSLIQNVVPLFALFAARMELWLESFYDS